MVSIKENIFIKTDYSLLKSLIKLDDLFLYASKNNYKTLGVIDDNLSYVAEFMNLSLKYNIKPVIGLTASFNDKDIIIYAKNYEGLKGLYKLNYFCLDNPLNIVELTKYITNFIILLPFKSKDIFHEFSKITKDIFIGYNCAEDKLSALLLTDNVIYFKEVLAINQKDTQYLNLLTCIDEGKTIDEIDKKEYTHNYLKETDSSQISDLIDIKWEKHSNLIPKFIENSDKYLEALSIKGLTKRLNGNIPDNYKERLLYELSVIKNMGYTDYFLIVYDYVKFAVKENILVGPGRGSAAGSLVTYSLGITSVDPIKYGLLFERFLNPERISMPDIDIDFDALRRHEVVEYIKDKYGYLNVMGIMTYGTLTAKQVLISLSKVYNKNIASLLKLINPKKTLKENLTKEVIKILNTDLEIKKIYYEAFKIEGIKKHISTHAAGIVISNTPLNEIIPVTKSGDEYLTGFTMNYLEDLGLLKMDLLAIKDLTTISEIVSNIKDDINIKEIPLDDKEVLSRFALADTTGIFQFESEGIKNFLRQLKPSSFNDIVVALALYRPGPASNIPSFIKRKEGREKIEYISSDLEDILKETYGIIVYQEQIMQILNKVASYSRGEADLIRRAISKMDKEVILKEKDKFIEKAINNNYSEKIATKIYELILKFANYGFNKSHSVAYAMIGYQMMYLKVKYKKEFYLSVLNINTGSNSKTKEYIDEAKMFGLTIKKPDINKSIDKYTIDKNIIMPLSIIKNIGVASARDIVLEREKGLYTSFYNFVSRTYGKSVNTKTIESLILAGAFDSFNETRKTLIENIPGAIIYAELSSGLDSSLVSVPNLEKHSEYPLVYLMEKELELYGFYVSNHPASKYKAVKINTIKNYFDKVIETVGLLENIKTITTKNNKTMAFLEISDETGKLDYVLFPNKVDYINRINKGDLLKVQGKVEKRHDKYQIIINKIDILVMK